MDENNDKYYLKLYEVDYDPGYVDGNIVIKKKEPIYEEEDILIGYEMKLDDFGGWSGLRHIKVPIYETRKVLIGYKYIWQVFSFQEFSS